MSGVELGARYRAGPDGVLVTFRHGSVAQLAPFASIRFNEQPQKIEGRLFRVGRRNQPVYEAPTLEPPEVKAS